MNAQESIGLAFPENLEAWRRWEASQGRVRRGLAAIKRRGRPTERSVAHLLLPEDEPDTLVVIDVWSPSCRAAVGEPLRAMDPRRTAVLTGVPQVLTDLSAGRHSVVWERLEQIPTSVGAVVTLGAYNDLAGQVEPWARRHDAGYFVVQHGLLTPWAPPLNEGARLLAWSEGDGRYWTAERPGLTWEVVGSQMLWKASGEPAVELADERPVMLGQLHGTELPRSEKQRLYTRFARLTGAEYRPHPNESDAISRAEHQLMRAAGVRFERSGRAVIDLGRPIVSIFSTGTLEAAHRGLPAWVHHPQPPGWLEAFWSRYGLSSYGGRPTAPMGLPEIEPAVAVARAVRP